MLNGTAFAAGVDGGAGGSLRVVGRREHHLPVDLLRMLRRVAAGARTALRPGHGAHLVDMPERANVVDNRVDVVPVVARSS